MSTIEKTDCDIPLIKPFTINKQLYVYDTYNNIILSVPKPFYKDLQLILAMGLSEYSRKCTNSPVYSGMIRMQKYGFFKVPWIKHIEHPDTDYLKPLIDRCINQIVLEMTTACNFRCRYCHQANSDARKEGIMSWNIARKSIDYLFDHSKDAPAVDITFYGGEPVLCFNTIRLAVDYAEERFESKKINYSITTNGSLLSDTVIEFLYKHNFSVMISMDGCPEYQNDHRKFAKNGADTFPAVWENIMKIKKEYPDYFLNNIRFNSVVFDDQDIQVIRHFYTENGISEKQYDINRAEMSGIDYSYSSITYHSIGDTDLQEKTYEMYIGKYKNKDIIKETWHHNGPCIPGVRRLFISSDGRFYTCEKIDKDPSCMIGDLENGIDLTKAQELLNIGKLTAEECSRCWCLHFCSSCASHCTNNGKLDRDKKLLYCEKQKQEVLSFLKDYVVVMTRNEG